MASGRLGAADLAATTNTSIYTVPASTLAVVSVSACNRNTSNVTFRLALCATATPSVTEYLEYEATIPAYGVLERTGIVMDTTKILVAYASTTSVSVVAWGFEEAA